LTGQGVTVASREATAPLSAAFARTVQSLEAVWVANEAPELLGGFNSPKHPWKKGKKECG
jgi:hypothetical protein